MYRITEECEACGACHSVCPVKAIKIGTPYVISAKCNDCGKCVEVCPVEAIIRDPDHRPH